jgi:hypothetical protein
MANDKPHPGEPEDPGKPADAPKGPPIHPDSGGDGDPPKPPHQ